MRQFHFSFCQFLACFPVAVIFSINIAIAEESIALSALGQYPKQFSQVMAVKQVKARAVSGFVTTRPGSTYQVVLPFTPQQTQFLPVAGQQVKQGQAVAYLDGLDVQHFFKQLEAAKTVYLESAKHLQNIQHYADSQTLKRGEWLAVNKRHLEAKLHYEHLSHINELLTITEQGQVQILSPKTGVISINTTSSSALFSVVANSDIVVRAQLPTSQANTLESVVNLTGGCDLQLIAVEQVVQDFHQTVWLTAQTPCKLRLGQQLMLQPVVTMPGYLVPITAVFELNDSDYVAIKRGQRLNLVAVTITAKQGPHYVVNSNEPLLDASVLSSSVSIAQGLFLGLGE